ncbi:MAG: phage tape measure protein, partial [Herbinix sp.]|nr:phage tape measure protein [Herbinix sp.]
NVASNTLAPNISVSFGDVHETADVDQMFGRIRTILREQIAIAPEGVY